MAKKLDKQKRQIFERLILPHLESAYNLARWLLPNNRDAEDITQEAYMKAFRLFDAYVDHDAKAWILTIVRNTCYSWIKKNKNYFAKSLHDMSEDELENYCHELKHSHSYRDPIDWLSIEADLTMINDAMNKLHWNLKEIIVLRDIEGCNYREIGEILEIPAGTVMSRLSRARIALQTQLAVAQEKRSEENA